MYKGENLKNNIHERDISYLLSPEAIRDTTKKILDLSLNGKTHFKVHLEMVEGCADYVLKIIKENYPDLDIPFHSRWGHFKVGGIDREKEFTKLLNTSDPMEMARAKLDLVITSVLLDAGAGKEWKYQEGNQIFTRSEGLAVASYHLFKNGDFSNQSGLLATAEGLSNFSCETLEQGFQVSDKNPLVGVKGRKDLIKKLGETVQNNQEIFPKQRPGSIIDYLCSTHGKTFTVRNILDAVLKGLGPIWPGRITVSGVNLGDVWHYPKFGEDLSCDSVVCFHKLSQWLTYSMVVPMIEAGLIITGAEELTGLAEYRNGGLFLDYGVLELRDKENFNKVHKPSSELIIEWRALTVQLLDQVSELVQKKLKKSKEEFPLAKVLEGGTWWAGRKIANEKRLDGSTPITLDSDGTVF